MAFEKLIRKSLDFLSQKTSPLKTKEYLAKQMVLLSDAASRLEIDLSPENLARGKRLIPKEWHQAFDEFLLKGVIDPEFDSYVESSEEAQEALFIVLHPHFDSGRNG